MRFAQGSRTPTRPQSRHAQFQTRAFPRINCMGLAPARCVHSQTRHLSSAREARRLEPIGSPRPRRSPSPSQSVEWVPSPRPDCANTGISQQGMPSTVHDAVSDESAVIPLEDSRTQPRPYGKRYARDQIGQPAQYGALWQCVLLASLISSDAD
ncbi:hypothetical protein PHLGIDRAFT_383744 [Phlebiopsis gigantea 11061_1 CR5-6]|uniref:Uncharacterized protein n=1 Tax=Phlebiopsis gigantea (strain 11061_1 CR5-6) TaxID=745531 RepID=A0A0C3PNH7_PHLG1|nr:hypothetical protein PHLGIDRAFT_383744 [Phlebiopsis gigantea 11061_1 CR5-6]